MASSGGSNSLDPSCLPSNDEQASSDVGETQHLYRIISATTLVDFAQKGADCTVQCFLRKKTLHRAVLFAHDTS